MNEPKDDLLIAIYKSGKVIRAEMSSDDMRNIGQQLIAMAGGVMIPGNVPADAPEKVKQDD